MAQLDSEAILSHLASLLTNNNDVTGYTLLIWTLRSFYLLSSIAILTVCLIPALRNRFLAYGARSHQHSPGPSDKANHQPGRFLDHVAVITVPHSWFTHFYVVAFALSAGRYLVQPYLTPQGRVCSNFMFFQSLRRLSECLLFQKTSSSRMWFGHYVVGLGFYIVTNFAIFLEGIDWQRWQSASQPGSASKESSPKPSETTAMLLYLVLGITMTAQFNQHQYLASLQKYTLPDRGAFHYLVAPHYTSEVIMYFAVALLGNGTDSIVNGTLFCAMIFVMVNLGVTAQGTQQWMLDKFPEQRASIANRWKMIPFIW